MRFGSFVTLYMAVLLIVYSYVGYRISASYPLFWRHRPLYWTVIFSLWISALLAPYVYRNHSSTFAIILSWIHYVSLGFFGLSFFFYLFVEPILQILRITHAHDPERRNFLQSSVSTVALGAASFGTLWGFKTARAHPKIFEVSVPILDLPEALQDFRIVQISDLHIGPTLRRSFVEGVVEQTLKLKPSLIAITGDVVDGHVDMISDLVAPLQKLKAPAGVYFITGNHENYWGPKEWCDHFRTFGFRVLSNENELITFNQRRLLIAGVTDHEPDPNLAFQAAKKADVRIFLVHKPHVFPDVNGYDLQLSGHTHGGQFWPFRLIVKQFFPYISGLYDLKGRFLYVNRGTGYWGPPLRLGIPSEISHIRFVKKL